MKPPINWAEEYMKNLDQEIRQIILDTVAGKISCHYFVGSEGLELADALPFIYLR
jgi:hypothetical protein